MSGSYVLFFVAGVTIASAVFVLNAKRSWRRYTTVLERGYVKEPAMKQKVALHLMVLTVILLISFEGLVFLGFIPGIDFYILPAFMIGFSVIPWFGFFLVIIWESRTGCRLYFDRKDENASMYVVREDTISHC